jgi:hypothetical protein
MTTSFEICGHAVTTTGRLSRVARLRDEYYDFLSNPAEFLGALTSHQDLPGNLFTFVQRVADRTPRFCYHLEWDSAAVLQVSTYENWWKKRINDKTRNMVRKAHKAGIEIRPVEFSDELVEGIVRIYNETPIRQGRRFRHFGKSFATIKKEHATFLDRSEFIGAYYKGELVGFIKLVHGEGVSNLMQIISMISQRDKAPNNALIAKAVESCTSRNTPLLHYGTWSRRSMGDFKKHHAFERWEIPRYYLPLNSFGSILLRCGLHRSLVSRVPEPWLDQFAACRSKWNSFGYSDPKTGGAVAQMAERRAQA